MLRTSDVIIAQYPDAGQLLSAPSLEVERVLLRQVVEYCSDGLHPMVTRDSISIGLFDANGYPHSAEVRADTTRVIGRAWKGLEDAGFIEEPDPANGKNGYRVPSGMGKRAYAGTDYSGVRMRSKFSRDMFHPALPDAAWNAFGVGDYDTAVFEAFKSLEVAVRTKGQLRQYRFRCGAYEKGFRPRYRTAANNAAPRPRRVARCELFTGAFRRDTESKGHNDPAIMGHFDRSRRIDGSRLLRRIVDMHDHVRCAVSGIREAIFCAVLCRGIFVNALSRSAENV